MSPSTTLLLLAFSFATASQAQVGVNNANPEQALDVGGKVKIGDDAAAPTAGTLRFDDTAEAFEGYDGTAWRSLTAGGGLPTSGAYPISSEVFQLTPASSLSMRFLAAGVINAFTPPAGKFFIVTHIVVGLRTNQIAADPSYSTFLSVEQGTRTLQQFPIYAIDGAAQEFTSGLAPLFVIAPGQSLRMTNQQSSAGSVYARVQGFLVDDLNY